MKAANPLDHKPPRNQFAGSHAKSTENPWTGVFKGRGKAARDRNRMALPISRLGITWRSLIDGVNLIESLLLSERSFTGHDPFDAFQDLVNARALGTTSAMLLDFLATSINQGVEAWSEEHGKAVRPILRSISGLTQDYQDNEFVQRLNTLVHGRDLTMDKSTIAEFDAWIQSRAAESAYEDLLIRIMKARGHDYEA